MTSCSCADHLHLHCYSSSRKSRRSWSRRRSLRPSLGPSCRGRPSSSTVARPCACSCACDRASIGTCHPCSIGACSRPCSRPCSPSSPGSRRRSVLACRTESTSVLSSSCSPGSRAASRTAWSATPARPLQARRTPRLAKTSKKTESTSWRMR